MPFAAALASGEVNRYAHPCGADGSQLHPLRKVDALHDVDQPAPRPLPRSGGSEPRMTPITLPGSLTSPIAGPLLRRGAPVIAHRQDGVPTDDVLRGVVISMSPLDIGWNDTGSDGRSRGRSVASRPLDAEEITAHLSLDLSDPAGMDIAARWLAAHYGLTVGATAPLWHRMTEIAPVWWLVGHSGLDREETDAEYRAVCAAFHDSDLVLPGRGGYGSEPRRIPGIAAITEPAEALRAACLAAVGRTG